MYLPNFSNKVVTIIKSDEDKIIGSIYYVTSDDLFLKLDRSWCRLIGFTKLDRLTIRMRKSTLYFDNIHCKIFSCNAISSAIRFDNLTWDECRKFEISCSSLSSGKSEKCVLDSSSKQYFNPQYKLYSWIKIWTRKCISYHRELINDEIFLVEELEQILQGVPLPKKIIQELVDTHPKKINHKSHCIISGVEYIDSNCWYLSLTDFNTEIVPENIYQLELTRSEIPENFGSLNLKI